MGKRFHGTALTTAVLKGDGVPDWYQKVRSPGLNAAEDHAGVGSAKTEAI